MKRRYRSNTSWRPETQHVSFVPRCATTTRSGRRRSSSARWRRRLRPPWRRSLTGCTRASSLWCAFNAASANLLLLLMNSLATRWIWLNRDCFLKTLLICAAVTDVAPALRLRSLRSAARRCRASRTRAGASPAVQPGRSSACASRRATRGATCTGTLTATPRARRARWRWRWRASACAQAEGCWKHGRTSARAANDFNSCFCTCPPRPHSGAWCPPGGELCTCVFTQC